jgi:hypothetical protein
VIACVSHNNVPFFIHYNAARLLEPSRGYWLPNLMAPLTSARQSGHTALWCDYADTVVVRVTHNDVAVPIHCDSAGFVELSNGPFSVLTAPFASARQNGHMALWCDFTNTLVARVSHNGIAIPIYCDPPGTVKLMSNGPLSVTMALLTSARQSGHMALYVV